MVYTIVRDLAMAASEQRVIKPQRAPAHARIAATLREQIERGELTIGAAIPSERELASSLGVSRMTARQALMILESEGLVRRHAPTGTTVSKRLPMRIGSFSDEVLRIGADPGDRLLWAEVQPPPPAAADALGLEAGDLVHVVSRLRTADTEPIALETTYLPERLTRGLLETSLSGSLWTTLRTMYDIAPEHANAMLEVVTLDEQTAALLEARVAAPAIQITRRTYERSGACFEYACDVYRSDRVRFDVDADIPHVR